LKNKDFNLFNQVLKQTILVVFFVCLFPVTKVIAGDTTNPSTILFFTPSSPNGLNGWYIQSVDLSISGSDSESGLKTIKYSLDDNDFVETNIEAGANLIENASFEEHSNNIPFYWNRSFYSSQIYVSDKYAIDGIYSARFNFNIWPFNFLTNEGYYAEASPFTEYFFSTWLKTNVVGFGTNYEIWAKKEGANELIYRSPTYFDFNDFEFLNTTFTTPVGTDGVYVYLYSIGWGDTYFDNLYLGEITTDASVDFNVSEEGEHTILFYSEDQALNVEDIKQESFKIDILPPSNWTNFDYVEKGNDHTLSISIDSTDSISGLNAATAEFQYYIEGVGWGVYKNLTSCSSEFLFDTWSPTSVQFINEPDSATLVTPKVDFCNSNWAQDKKIKFRINDNAGNIGISPEYNLNSPWILATNGDVGSNNSITFSAESIADHLINSYYSVSNMTSLSNIKLQNYSSNLNTSASYYINNNSFEKLPENKLQTQSGSYIFTGNITLDNPSINNYNKNTLCSVVAIDGTLTFSKDLILKDSNSCLVFLVTGNVIVKDTVTEIESFIITDGSFNTGTSHSDLFIRGGVIANELILTRSLKAKENLDNPSEIFSGNLDLLFNARKLISTIDTSAIWKEL